MPPKAYDVWFLAANTVYRGVPYSVLTDWAQQGRVAAADKVRAAGTEAWVRIGETPAIADFLFIRQAEAPAAVPARHAEELEPVEMEGGWAKSPADDDDDVDMIPLIDISLVLLIFFMMTATVSSLSPVPVPDMKNAAELHGDPDSFTVHIDKNGRDELYFAVRVGERTPAKDDTDLISLGDVLVRLDVLLATASAEGKRAPEVRIACHKDLPAGRVHELAKELQRRKEAGKIAFFGAEVNERSK